MEDGSSVAMLPDWSDDEGDTSSPPPQPQLSPLGSIAFREHVEEFKSILRSIEFQGTTDLKHALASRAHLERLVDRYWDLSLKYGELNKGEVTLQQVQEEPVSEERILDEEVMAKLKEMILHHPSFRVSPLLLRWPLLATDAPKPAWTLGDEVMAVLDKLRRAAADEDATLPRADPDKDKALDPVDSDIALPVVVSCQHALLGMLHDLALRSQRSSRSITSSNHHNPRETILTWRDVLSTLSMRSDVPASVYKATKDRLEAIYGQAEKVPLTPWMSTMGMGGSDNISETLKGNMNDAIPLKWQHASRKSAMSTNQRKTMRELDEVLLLAPSGKRSRYLEQAPTSRRKRKVPTQS